MERRPTTLSPPTSAFKLMGQGFITVQQSSIGLEGMSRGSSAWFNKNRPPAHCTSPLGAIHATSAAHGAWQLRSAGFVPINGPGMQIAENVDSAIQVEFRGSFMAGSLINDGNLPGIPAQAFRNKNLLTSDNAAGWIMAACHDGRRIVVALEITLQSGGAYVVATDAGYVNAACALTAYAANNVWRTWDTVDVAACATCSGYGIHSLETYLAPGKLTKIHGMLSCTLCSFPYIVVQIAHESRPGRSLWGHCLSGAVGSQLQAPVT
eukprot:364589-Chlamydomonas_euryale.AAC.9